MSLTAKTHRVLVAEDHPVMREGLRLMIDQQPHLQVIAEAVDGAEAITQYRIHRPDVTLMDLRMPNVDGLDAIRGIRELSASAIIVVLTSYPGDARASSALSLGASAYILKTSTIAEIVAAIGAALCGRSTLTPDVKRDLNAWKGARTLTQREIDVLRLAAVGKQNRVIAAELNISEQTVKSRVRSILAKLEAGDRTHAVTIAMRRGFFNG